MEHLKGSSITMIEEDMQFSDQIAKNIISAANSGEISKWAENLAWIEAIIKNMRSIGMSIEIPKENIPF